jgi:hypothetical protein
MGKAGNYERVPFDRCKCGKSGFKRESDVTKHVLNLRRMSEPVEKIQCPVGDCWHVFNPLIKEKDAYVKMLTETAGRVFRPKMVEPPAAEKIGASVELRDTFVGPPPDAPAPSATAPCAKIGYANEHLAAMALRSLQKGRDEKRTYQCPQCRRWHLTSLEFERSTVVEEELVALGTGFESAVVVLAGRYPDGSLASLLFRSAKGTIRIRGEYLPVIALAMEYAMRTRDLEIAEGGEEGLP